MSVPGTATTDPAGSSSRIALPQRRSTWNRWWIDASFRLSWLPVSRTTGRPARSSSLAVQASSSSLTRAWSNRSPAISSASTPRSTARSMARENARASRPPGPPSPRPRCTSAVCSSVAGRGTAGTAGTGAAGAGAVAVGAGSVIDDAGKPEDLRRWEVLVTDLPAQRGERVRDRVRQGRRGDDRAALPDAPEPELAVGVGVEMLDLDLRNLGRGRHEVVHERAGEHVAVDVVGGVLVEDLADALRDAAADLAVHDRRVDHPPAVLDHHVARDVDLAGAQVHLDDAGVGGTGPATAGDALAAEPLLGHQLAVEAWRQRVGHHRRLHGDLRDRERLAGPVAGRHHAVVDL